MTIDEQITQIKRAIGAFFRARRENMGWTRNDLRAATNTSGLQVQKIEEGIDSVGTDTFFRVMLALGIGTHYTVQDSNAAEVCVEGAAMPPPFLVYPDGERGQLYILHWQKPAFLVQVVHTTLYHLRVVATYGPPADAVKQLPVWAELETFVKDKLAQQADDLNP